MVNIYKNLAVTGENWTTSAEKKVTCNINKKVGKKKNIRDLTCSQKCFKQHDLIKPISFKS